MTLEQTQAAIAKDPRTISDAFEHLPFFSFGLLEAKFGAAWVDEMCATITRYEAQVEAAFPENDDDEDWMKE